MIRKIESTLVLSVMMLFFVACENAETVDRYYPDYKQLGTADEPGNWVPTFVPPSAVEIRARYKIDTGAELLTFNVGRFEDLSVVKHCNKVTMNDLQLPPSGFLNVVWWPELLYQDQAQKENHTRYEFYRCDRQAFLALERINGATQAFYWRISLSQ